MTTSTGDLVTSKPSQIKNIINRALLIDRAVFLWGPPGIGKSEIVASIVNELPGNNLMIDMRLALFEPTDLRGYPFRNPATNEMEWSPPADLPNKATAEKYDTIVLFLDELNSAPPSVQAAAYQLILNKRIGNYELPENTRIVAAGNRETDRGVTYKMPSPLANRFRHLQMREDFDDWLLWAIKNKIHSDVVGYISFSRGSLYNFDPKNNTVAFATPRSWSYVSELLHLPEFHQAPEEEQKAEIAGAIGDGTAVEFFEYRRIASEVPDIDLILDGKFTEMPKKSESIEMSLTYAIITSMLYRLNERIETAQSLARAKAKEELKKCDVATNNVLRFGFSNFKKKEMVIYLLISMVRGYDIDIKVSTLDKDVHDQFIKTYRQMIDDPTKPQER